MSARTLETFEQFEQFQDDGLKHELLEGEHIAVPPANFKHNTISHNLLWILKQYVSQNKLVDVRIEAGFKLGANNWLQPDVSFIRTAHLEKPQPRGYIEDAPAIAIEVASESNTPKKLDRKRKLFFAYGSEEVWTVFPETKQIRIDSSDGRSRIVTDQLETDLFPGRSVAVSAIFSN
jgi:Uma2 family endonuclease